MSSSFLDPEKDYQPTPYLGHIYALDRQFCAFNPLYNGFHITVPNPISLSIIMISQYRHSDNTNNIR